MGKSDFTNGPAALGTLSGRREYHDETERKMTLSRAWRKAVSKSFRKLIRWRFSEEPYQL